MKAASVAVPSLALCELGGAIYHGCYPKPGAAQSERICVESIATHGSRIICIEVEIDALRGYQRQHRTSDHQNRAEADLYDALVSDTLNEVPE